MAASAPKSAGGTGVLGAQITAPRCCGDAIRACNSDRLRPRRVARPSEAHPVAPRCDARGPFARHLAPVRVAPTSSGSMNCLGAGLVPAFIDVWARQADQGSGRY